MGNSPTPDPTSSPTPDPTNSPTPDLTNSPTADPTSPTYHYVVQGAYVSSPWSADDEDYYCERDDETTALYATSYHTQIATGCCSMDGSKGYRPDCNAHDVTYDEAEALCASHGYRLCTLDEMHSGLLTKGKGCSYDYAYNWVSDQCTMESTYSSSVRAPMFDGSFDGDRDWSDNTDWMKMDYSMMLSMKHLMMIMMGLVIFNMVLVVVLMLKWKRKRVHKVDFDRVDVMGDSEEEDFQKEE